MKGPVVVIGAGVSGLTLGWRLVREGHDVVVLESGSTAGGAIRTTRREGVVLEQGPQALASSAVHAFELIEALGLGERVLQADPASRNRFIWWQGRLEPVPGSLPSGRLLPRRALLRALLEPLVPRRRDSSPETVAELVSRRFGPLVAERLAEPFVTGVFGGDVDRLEAEAAFPDLVRHERERGSVILGMMLGRRHKPPGMPRTLYTLRGGLDTLPQALAGKLGERLRLDTPVERVERVSGGFRVHARGGPYEAGTVAVCIPGPRAAAFLPELSAELAAIPTAPIAAVQLAYRPEDLPGGLPGFGWLAPRSQLREALGCLWVSGIFPDQAPGVALLRVMMGGARAPEVVAEGDEALVAGARHALRQVQGLEAEPLFAQVAAHPAGIPQYERGHAARVRRLQSAIPGLGFLGWGYTGIGVEHAIAAASTWAPGG